MVAPTRAERPQFSAERVDFRVRFKEEVSAYRVLGVYVVPGRELKLEMEDNGKKTYTVTGEEGSPSRISRGRWKWTAPYRPGLYPVQVTQNESGESMTLNVFVMVPIDSVKNQALNGYRIGDYFWAKPWDRPIYRAPPGMIEVTPDLLDARVSPHFTLGQFVCKQAGGYPKYMVLRERLLLKLELILEAVNEAGYRCDTFAVLSGYRTPWYNKSIGNVKYSRHVWGGAADIFVDENPKDGMMDDLNKDGKIDIRDAGVLYKIIDPMHRRSFYAPFIGGLGRYKKNPAHGPYVHVDARGRRTRWGN
jgi:hypothetical protein